MIKQRFDDTVPGRMICIELGGTQQRVQLLSLISIESNLKFKTEEIIVKSTFARVVICLVVLALSLTAFAASKNGAVTSADKHMTFTPPVKAAHTGVEPDAGLPIIFSLLASKDPKGLYFCCEGYTISGANSVIAESIWVAQGFTPASSTTTTKLTMAISYVTGTYTDVILGIYADCSGIPCSTALWTKKLTLDTQVFGACCAVEKKTVKPGVALTGGTQYWVGVTTESASDIWAAWNVEVLDEVDTTNVAYDDGGSGWFSYATNLGNTVQVQ